MLSVWGANDVAAAYTQRQGASDRTRGFSYCIRKIWFYEGGQGVCKRYFSKQVWSLSHEGNLHPFEKQALNIQHYNFINQNLSLILFINGFFNGHNACMFVCFFHAPPKFKFNFGCRTGLVNSLGSRLHPKRGTNGFTSWPQLPNYGLSSFATEPKFCTSLIFL